MEETGADMIDADTLRKTLRAKVTFTQLARGALDHFLRERIHPEICLDAQELNQFPEAEFRRIAGILHMRGLNPTIHAPFLDMDPAAVEPRTRNRARKILEKTVRIAENFRPEVIVCHGGDVVRMHLEEKRGWVERALPVFRDVARWTRDIGSKLVMENICESGPQELEPLIGELAEHDAGWCLDVGHLRIFSKVDVAEWVRVLGPHLAHVHLHDNLGRADLHLAVGRGVIDFQTLFEALAKLPRPSATLEVDYEGDLEFSLRTLEKVWPW